MKKRLGVFPFSEEIMTILRHKNKINDYEFVYAILPKGWEASDDSADMNYFCPEERFYEENLIHSLDAVLLCKPVFHIDITIYNRIIALADQYGKEIIYVSELRSAFANHNKESWLCLTLEQVETVNKKRLTSLDVPVVMVLGLGENCEKWDIQLEISDFFHQRGYKTSLISSNSMSKIMGFHTLPSSLNSPGLTFSQKVESVNSFIKNIELNEHPDLIILGVPGGIFKYSQTIPNDYGYLPFLICNAVKPDITILSMYCGIYDEEHIKEIQTTCLYRFSAKVDYFQISKIACNYSFETEQLNYYSIEKDYLTEEIIKSHKNENIFNILDTYSREKVFEKIMLELQTNVATV